MNTIPENTELILAREEDAGEFELGAWLGRRQAFQMISGRCSAADVQCMRTIRDNRLYRAKNVDWSGFCDRFLGLTRSYADRLIRNLDKFGPQFFQLSEITRMSPQSYQLIAKNVEPDGLAYEGELIPIAPENSERLVAAVRALQSRAEQERTGDDAASEDRAGRIKRTRKQLEQLMDEVNELKSTGSRSDAGLRDLVLVGSVRFVEIARELYLIP